MALYYDKGKYRCKIVDQRLGENKNGNPELQLTVHPIGVYTAGQVEDISSDFPRTIFLVMTDNTMGDPDNPGWVLQAIKNLGFNGKSFAQLDKDHPEAVTFIGQEVDCVCDHETYNGKEREKWNLLGSNRQMINKPLPTKAIRGLDTRFSKFFNGTDKPSKNGKKEPVHAGAPDSLPDPPAGRKADEIPF